VLRLIGGRKHLARGPEVSLQNAANRFGVVPPATIIFTTEKCRWAIRTLTVCNSNRCLEAL
jgi:hypothetical protein